VHPQPQLLVQPQLAAFPAVQPGGVVVGHVVEDDEDLLALLAIPGPPADERGGAPVDRDEPLDETLESFA